MPNTNCLEGIACPECKSEGPFAIHSCALVLMSDNGGEETTDIEWSPASAIACQACNHAGRVRDFTAEKRPEEFSVLLRYPDYLNDGGNETYYGFTTALTPQDAIANVQAEAAKANDFDEDGDPEDFAPLLVLPGHIIGLPTT